MASNITQISGATEIRLYFRNYTYASASSDLAALEMVNFTDLDRLGYKNIAGTLRKLLEDSSGATNHPGDRVLYTDSDGRATSSADFTFDGSNIVLPPLEYGWQFVATASALEIYKDGSPTGIKLAEI